MTRAGYVFDRVRRDVERERLAAIEALFDPATRRLLEATGLEGGWRCLEVGAGGGSVARWLADRGPSVVALDLDARFLREAPGKRIEIVEADILGARLEPASFDLVHARYVLLHIVDHERALDAMLRALKPGGFIVLEEPDFSIARAAAGSDPARRAFARVHHAVATMFRSRGMDGGLGFRLPEMLLDRGLVELAVENETPLAQGGSGIAEMMRLSAIQLGDTYVSTGEASADDVEVYCRFAQDPDTWAVYYATVRACARMPAGKAR